MKKLCVAAVAVVFLGSAGCSDLTQQEKQALTGGAVGAVGGTIVGAMAGSPAVGAAIGGAAGAATGALWDDISKRLE
ncbi:MAG: YMGG-like glycine zipper-containing protein [Pseudomonadota bacterium]